MTSDAFSELAAEIEKNQAEAIEALRKLLVGRTITDIDWDGYGWTFAFDDDYIVRAYDVSYVLYHGNDIVAEALFEE